MNSKTPVTVLQELMTKYLQIPSYECVSQTGPQHQSVFEYRCVAHGVTARGVARSKKEAKHEAARRALAALAARGLPVPPPYCTAPDPEPGPAAAADEDNEMPALALPSSSKSGTGAEGGTTGATAACKLDSRSSVALLKELCEEYRLGAVTYELVGDTGPPHQRRFTIRAVLASHERVATATTKKAARQLAAEQLYLYLRENLATATKDFVENRTAELLKGQSVSEKCTENANTIQSPMKRKSTDEAPEEVQSKRSCDVKTLKQEIVEESEEALTRAVDKAMSRYVELREETPRRPDLGQRIADYHLGVFDNVSEEQLEEAQRALSSDSEEALQRAADALGLTVERSTLPAEGGALAVVALSPTAPALALAGTDPPAAARAALRYLRRAMEHRPDSSYSSLQLTKG